MGGGGKGSSPTMAPTVAPTYTDPVSGKSFGTSAELNENIDKRQTGSSADTTAANSRIMEQNAQNHATFLAKSAAAKAQATENMNQYFRDQGVDPTLYSKQIADAVNTQSSHLMDPGEYGAGMGNDVPTTTTANGVTTTAATTPASLINYEIDPSSVYAATGGSDLYNQLQSGKQSQALQGYNSIFSPSYSQEHLSSSMIDPAVQSVLDQQFNPLGDQLSNASKRGSLNTRGYDAALNALGTAKTGARSTVSKLAQGVLSGDQSNLDSYIGTGRTAAGTVPLGSTFDANPYVTGATDRAARDTSNFGGDVQNAVGNTKFSDLTSLLNAGGLVQGANDPTATNPNGAPAGQNGDLSPAFIAQQAIANQTRGLGTSGAF